MPYGEVVVIGPLAEIVPLVVTSPVLLDVCDAFTFVELLLPTIVVLTMLCEPIAVMEKFGPAPTSRPSLAAFTWPAALPSWACRLAESVRFPDEEPHIRLDETEPDVLVVAVVVYAWAAVENASRPATARSAPIEANSLVMIRPSSRSSMTN